jgi:hypothetical protein
MSHNISLCFAPRKRKLEQKEPVAAEDVGIEDDLIRINLNISFSIVAILPEQDPAIWEIVSEEAQPEVSTPPRRTTLVCPQAPKKRCIR